MNPLSDDDIDAELTATLYGYDPGDQYPEWGNAALRDAYRAGREDGRLERDRHR